MTNHAAAHLNTACSHCSEILSQLVADGGENTRPTGAQFPRVTVDLVVHEKFVSFELVRLLDHFFEVVVVLVG